MEQKIKHFLNEQGRIKQLPSKRSVREEVFRYLSSKFEVDIKYTEKEVNQILTKWSTIEDYSILRRGLIDSALLIRTPDGSQYWKNMSKDENKE